MNIDRCFRLAKNASEFSDCKIKMGSVIVSKNKVLSVGWNTNKSDPTQKRYNRLRTDGDRYFDTEHRCNGIHSEYMAIKRLNGDMSKCSIFIYSNKKDGSTRMSKPCNACLQLLKDKGIKHIYYVTENGYNYERI